MLALRRGVSAEARKHADDIKAKLTAGDYVIFKGPIMDNKGKTVIAAGTARARKTPNLKRWTIWSKASSERLRDIRGCRSHRGGCDFSGGESGISAAPWRHPRIHPHSGRGAGRRARVFGIFVALFGKSPLDLYFYMYQGAFGTWFSWQNTLTRAAPLILTALCTALPAQLGMVIIGGEGALLIGALAATGTALMMQSAPPLVCSWR